MNWNEFRSEVNMLLISKKGYKWFHRIVSQDLMKNHLKMMNEARIKLREFVRKAFETQIWLVKLIDCETFFIKTFAGKANIYDSSSQRDKGKQDKKSRLSLASEYVSNFLIESEIVTKSREGGRPSWKFTGASHFW